MRSRRLLLLPLLLPLAFCEGGRDKVSTAEVKGPGFQAGSDEAFLLRRAENGDAEAQYDLGTRCFYGQGMPRNEAQAVHWFKKAAESGHGAAQNFVALMYGQGQGVTVDFAQAAAWALKAAEQGQARGQGLLAMMIFDGRGVPRDAIEGYKWAILAAARTREDDMKEYVARSLQIMASKMTEGQIAEANDRARKWTAAWLVVEDEVREKAVRTFCAEGPGPWFVRVESGLPSADLLARFEADPRFRSVAEANKGPKNPFGQPAAGSVVDVGAIEWRGARKALIRLGNLSRTARRVCRNPAGREKRAGQLVGQRRAGQQNDLVAVSLFMDAECPLHNDRQGSGRSRRPLRCTPAPRIRRS